jgi:hypothetical protein
LFGFKAIGEEVKIEPFPNQVFFVGGGFIVRIQFLKNPVVSPQGIVNVPE